MSRSIICIYALGGVQVVEAQIEAELKHRAYTAWTPYGDAESKLKEQLIKEIDSLWTEYYRMLSRRAYWDL